MKIATIIGARPQFIKAAALSQEIRKYGSLTEIIIHTGQHYDYQMSKLFFEELDIPAPHYNLEVGSASHGFQTGKMLIGIEEVVQKEKPDLVIVYGDTNSTIAGALASAKLHIPVAHIEAGMRSFSRQMPEEINRIVSDHISTLLFCSTQTAVNNLKEEGITKGVYLTGDVMYDIALKSIAVAQKKSNILNTLSLKPQNYYLATVHRQSNTDDLDNLKRILEAFAALDLPVVFPVHPRTKKAIESVDARYRNNTTTQQSDNIIFTEPVGYLDMLVLEKNARKILTDSGGVQKEAYFFKVPCITLREETEWVETIDSNWNILAGTDKKKIISATEDITVKVSSDTIFGNGRASEKICQIIADWLDN